jgi:ribosomal protein L30/L7E
MSEQEQEFIKSLKVTLATFKTTMLKWVIITALGLFVSLVTFVYKTSYTQKNIESKQVEMQDCQKKHEDALINLNLRKVDRAEYREDLKEIKDAMIRIEAKIDRRY